MGSLDETSAIQPARLRQALALHWCGRMLCLSPILTEDNNFTTPRQRCNGRLKSWRDYRAGCGRETQAHDWLKAECEHNLQAVGFPPRLVGE